MIAGQLFHRTDAPIGVEIHAGGVRLLQVRKSRAGLTVRGAANVDVQPAGRAADDAAWLKELSAAAGKAASGGGFAGTRCVVGLDGRMVRTRSIRQPAMSDEEIEKSLKLDGPTRLGFAEGQSAEIDWMRAGEVRQGDEVREELLFLGARREPIETLLFALAEHGLQPIAVEPAFSAIARCYTRSLRRASDEQTARIIIDIGLEATEVIVTRGRQVAFYKQLEIGGNAMTKAAAERLGLDPATVIDLRRRRMSAAGGADAAELDPKVERALFDAVRPVINNLANEATLCLRYYSVTFRGSRPESVVIAGEDAGEPQLAQSIGEALHLPANVGNPLEGADVSKLSGSNVPGARNLASGWGAAMGLSLRLLEQSAVKRTGVVRAREAA